MWGGVVGVILWHSCGFWGGTVLELWLMTFYKCERAQTVQTTQTEKGLLYLELVVSIWPHWVAESESDFLNAYTAKYFYFFASSLTAMESVISTSVKKGRSVEPLEKSSVLHIDATFLFSLWEFLGAQYVIYYVVIRAFPTTPLVPPVVFIRKSWVHEFKAKYITTCPHMNGLCALFTWPAVFVRKITGTKSQQTRCRPSIQ